MTQQAQQTAQIAEALENLLNWHETKSPDFALRDQLIKDAWKALDGK